MKSIVFVTHEEHRYAHELFARVMRDHYEMPVFVADYATPGIVLVTDALVVLCDLERFGAQTSLPLTRQLERLCVH
jgi:hypothetical protein